MIVKTIGSFAALDNTLYSPYSGSGERKEQSFLTLFMFVTWPETESSGQPADYRNVQNNIDSDCP